MNSDTTAPREAASQDDLLIGWMHDALSELAGIETHDVNLRDNPAVAAC